MHLAGMKIHNYRNLDGLELDFSPTVNFIVGENRIGKTNILNLLQTIFCCSYFSEHDFADKNKEIRVEIILDGAAEPSGTVPHRMEVEAVQESPGENYLRFWEKYTGKAVSHTFMKQLNYLGFDSLRNPTSALENSDAGGLGMLFRFLLAREEQTAEAEKTLVWQIYELLKGMEPFRSSVKSGKMSREHMESLARLLKLFDIPVEELQGDMQQLPFSAKILLALLERMEQFRGSGYSDGRETFSALLVLDEPEIHLHPYRQRRLVKELLNVTENNSKEISDILFNLYGAKQIDGQIIIVTYSSNIILDNYREIIRVFRQGKSIRAVNGARMRLSAQNQKHLLMQFSFVKEALFSRCVILVEGETECGSVTEFGSRMGVDFDKYGIALMKASGAGSIIPLMRLFENFRIPVIGIMDRDIKEENPNLSHRNLLFTDTLCFESEVVDSLLAVGKESVLQKILARADAGWKKKKIYRSTLNKILEKYHIPMPEFQSYIRYREHMPREQRRLFYLAYLSMEKSITLGRTIAECLREEEIPPVYRRAILKARDFSGR